MYAKNGRTLLLTGRRDYGLVYMLYSYLGRTNSGKYEVKVITQYDISVIPNHIHLGLWVNL